MTDDQLRNAILDELLEQDWVPPREPGDFTLQEYVERAGISEATARYRLKVKVQKGLLETTMVQGATRRKVRVWRLREGGRHDRQTP